MTAAEAVDRAHDSLASAEDAAGSGLSEQAQAWVAVADGWNRLAATIAQACAPDQAEAAQGQGQGQDDGQAERAARATQAVLGAET